MKKIFKNIDWGEVQYHITVFVIMILPLVLFALLEFTKGNYYGASGIALYSLFFAFIIFKA